MNLRLSKNTISGNLMGTPVTGMTRSAVGGTSPTAGLYDISPPISDPVFGMHAYLTPATGSSPAGSAKTDNFVEVKSAATMVTVKSGGSPAGSMASALNIGSRKVVAQQGPNTGPV